MKIREPTARTFPDKYENRENGKTSQSFPFLQLLDFSLFPVFPANMISDRLKRYTVPVETGFSHSRFHP